MRFLRKINGIIPFPLSAMAQDQSLIVRILASSVRAADHAGTIIRSIMTAGNLNIVEKGKNDLQTEADRAAQRCIVSSLMQQYPDVKVIGEEGTLSGETNTDNLITDQDSSVLSIKCPENLSSIQADKICVWVDPLDGTSEYTQGLLDHVTVLIGIAVGSEAIGGVIHQPYYNYKSGGEMGRTIWGLKGAGVGGFISKPPPKERVVTTTRSHCTGLVDQVLEATKPDEIIRVGGAGHKVMLLLDGKARAYVFASPGSKRWDTCAPEAILREVGGELTDMFGHKYDYSQSTHPNNSRGVLATAVKSEHEDFVELVAPIVKDKMK